MAKLNQRGAIDVIVIALLVVVALVGIGAWVYLNNRDKNDSSTNINNTQPLAADAESSKPEEKESDEDLAKKAAKEHFELINAGDIDGAYESTCQAFKDNTTLADFKNIVSTDSTFSVNLSGVEYTDAEVRNDQARISGEIGPLLPDTVLEVDLLSENNQWCVFGYRTK